MQTNHSLKEQLQAISRAEYAVPEDVDAFSLALVMLDQIGSTDSELRDRLIYSTFSRWILRVEAFSTEQLKMIWSIALDDQHLSYKVGEVDTDSVFTRSFSVLLLPLLLIYHRRNPVFSQAELHQTKERLLAYLSAEQDLRGFVPGKGWAHAAAHSGDALDDLALCQEVEAGDLQDILQGISAKMSFDRMPFLYEEDERMTTAVMSVLSRQLVDIAYVKGWIDDLGCRAIETKRSPSSFCRLNIKNFLRCVYFRLQSHPGNEDILQHISSVLAKINS